MAVVAASCGSGNEDAASDHKQVQYSGAALIVNGNSFAPRSGDFITSRGTIYVFTSAEANAQADLTMVGTIHPL